MSKSSGTASSMSLMNSRFRLAVLAGVLLGCWHLYRVFDVFFVIGERELVPMLIAVFTGPLLTLPATVVAFWRAKWATRLLVGGGLVSVVPVMTSGDLASVAGWFALCTLPMAVVGSLFSLATSSATSEKGKVM
jgi:hypothetical protein